jgi:hypothetical protein
MKLYKKSQNFAYLRPDLRSRENVYIPLRTTTDVPAGNMDLILTVDIEGQRNLKAVYFVLPTSFILQVLDSKEK